MRSPLIVVDSLEDWKPYAEGPTIVEAPAYLESSEGNSSDTRVINLCRDCSYQSVGYYVSLLAEARGKRALPSVRTWLELSGDSPPLHDLRQRVSKDTEVPAELGIHFGRSQDPRFAGLAAAVFNRFPAPILFASLRVRDGQVEVHHVRLGRTDELDDSAQTLFADALDGFNHRIWRTRGTRRNRLDLAILVDPDEALPPSNNGALRLFERAGRSLGFDVERITLEDSPRLLEFDALFIRTTTAIHHATYRMAQLAEREGMAVIDDPDSILRCCNKVFLHDLFKTHGIGMPETRLVMRHPAPSFEALIDDLGLPMVLKVPDGSFSRGVFKVTTRDELQQRTEALLEQTAVVLAQAFVPTDYDWRIGVLEGRALYACRYHMARDHWQIYNHASSGRGQYGGHECLPLARVPSSVLRTAVRAAKLVGNGLYGVDVKEVDGEAKVIEVNDNPSIDAGVEDSILGEELYRQILAHLLNTVQSRGRGS